MAVQQRSHDGWDVRRNWKKAVMSKGDFNQRKKKEQLDSTTKKFETTFKKLRGKSISLTPNLRFGGPQAMARCKNAWKQLFELLYEHQITAEFVSEFQWRVDADNALVQLTPLRADDFVDSDLWTKQPMFEFAIDDFLPEAKKLKGPKNAPARVKRNRQFRDWIADAVVESFQSEPIQIEYSWFNEDDHPFSMSIMLTADKKTDKPILLWSNTRRFKPRPKKKALKKGPAKKRPDYSHGGWQRFYFDDGKTRRFWYIQCKGAMQMIVQGNIGTDGELSTKKLKSPKEAKATVQKAIDSKVIKGYIEYAPDNVRYFRKARFAMGRIKKELAEFEKVKGFRIPEQYRRHVLAVNGGIFWDSDHHSYVSLPAHPSLDAMEINSILGFATQHPHESIASESARTIFPDGHTPCVDGYFTFTIDQVGTVYMLQMDDVTRQDYGDDGFRHLDRIAAYPVAHCFDEFLTRIARFPNDINTAKKAKTREDRLAEINERFARAREAAEALPFRLFFFDDGKGQKFWNIETKGKQFTTSYGGFGNRPSTTTKKFPTVDKAKKTSQAIIAQKLKKGYHEVLPDALHIQRPKKFKRATVAAIKKLEKELGSKLPDVYRQFLETQNGGEPTPDTITIPGIPYIESVEVGYLFGLYSDPNDSRSLHSGMETAKRLLPDGYLVIANGGGDFFTLSLKRKPGCIWFWDHESSDSYQDTPGHDRFRPSAAHLLANSFEEFLTRIAMYQET